MGFLVVGVKLVIFLEKRVREGVKNLSKKWKRYGVLNEMGSGYTHWQLWCVPDISC